MHTLVLPARRLHFSDASWAAELLAEAYAADPYYQGLLPETTLLKQGLTLLVDLCLQHGRAYASPDDQAVVLWLPADAARLGNRQWVAWTFLRQLVNLGWRRAYAMVRWQQRQDAVRHRLLPGPHHYLMALGVRPTAQRQGVGRALLRASMAALGGRFMPCYTDVHTLPAMHFAQRLGFEVLAHQLLPVTEAVVPSWSLVRPAMPV